MICIAEEDAPASEKHHRCTKCGVAKTALAFRPQSLARSFYICKTCADKQSAAHRRNDPASRIASRLRARGLRIGVAEIRLLLAGADAAALAQDLIAIERLRPDEPLSANNAVVRPRGARLVRA